ncbi:MAG: hypothetical protein E7248_20485 [Paenibacillaceae bacterium]|nr:hypothetical protein [Paenibacillaceae bacterium]
MRKIGIYFHSRIVLAAVLSGVIVLSVPSTGNAYGAGPGQAGESIPEGMTKEQWDRLNDQVIEFDELPDLVRYFNPDVQNTVTSITNSIGNTQYIYDAMRGYIRDLESDADELKDSGETASAEGMVQYNVLNTTVKSLKTSADTMKQTLDYMNRADSSTKSNITQAVKNYTNYANQLMISYNSAQSGLSSLKKLVEADTAILDSVKARYSLGTAAHADVLSAQKDLLSAQSSLLSLENTTDSLRRSLCLMTGYSAESQPVIGGIPQLDMTEITNLDLEADTEMAVRNNYSLISDRHASSGKTTTGMKYKEAGVLKGEQTVAVTMQSNYHAVQQAKAAYEAACTAYEMAALEWGKAEHLIQHGLISKNESLQAQMKFLQAESEKQSTYNDLYQAYDTYQWAMLGL